MAQFKSVEKVKTAVEGVYKKSLYHRSLSTQGFMAIQPYFVREFLPKEHINAVGEVWSRLNTLVLPIFGDCDYHLNKFFVRFKDVWPLWDDYYNESNHSFGDGSFGYVPNRPYFHFADFFELMKSIGAVTLVPVVPGQPADDYDLLVIDTAGSTNANQYKVNDSFVNVFSLMQQLGYEFSWDYNDYRRWDMLPLMCYGKIYIDHYFPRQYRSSAMYMNVAAMFSYNGPIVDFASNSIYQQGLESIFRYCTHSYYDNDGVYMAWDNPVGPNTKDINPFRVEDNTNTAQIKQQVTVLTASDGNISPSQVAAQPIDGTPFLSSSTTGSSKAAYGVVTKNLLDMLYRISNAVKRYQLAGNSAAARFLATFGFDLGDTHTSFKLGSERIPVRVGDVESNSDSQVTVGADTYTSLLGNLAGKGVASDGFRITFNGDSNAGYYMMLLSIIPDAGIYQGLDRRLLNVNIADTIKPTNDSLGVRAISVGEVFNSDNGQYNHNHLQDVFGFLPFGWEHVVGRNVLAGAFRLRTQGSAQLAPYHLYRDLHLASFFAANPHIGLNFLAGADAGQYNRVFYNMAASQQFIIRFRLKYDSYSFKKPLYDNYDWNLDDDNQQVTLDGNGVGVN